MSPSSTLIVHHDGLDAEIQPQNHGKLKVAVVGGGLVGSLNAIYFAKRGHDVTVYELRKDMRYEAEVRGRSINLALSARGRAALREVGLEDRILKHGIPMYGRMIHDRTGTRKIFPYGKKGQCIYSVGRRYLNEALLTAAEKCPNTRLFFRHKLIHGDLEEGLVTFLNMEENKEIRVESDLILGCDGAFSAVRRQMMKQARFNFSQSYIEHGYMELCIPPVVHEDGSLHFALEPHYLHIWPRRNFMLIALPNEDRSWTVTLFMPFQTFDKLNTDELVVDFFQENFPDAIQLIGRERLCKDFFKAAASPLVSVKCTPYHTKASVIMGDAAHAMVPFYGQGMNAGLEDCLIFNELMQTYDANIGEVLAKFSKVRQPDAEAICDLALYNYTEMRDLVNSQMFRFRKTLDMALHACLPSTWVPLYTTVTFSRTPYRECIANKSWQDQVLRNAFVVGGMVLAVLALVFSVGVGWMSRVCEGIH